MEPWRYTGVELRQKFIEGEISARDIVKAYLERIDRVEPRVRAFIRVTDREALSRAEGLDQGRRRGKHMGLLAAIPIAVKDNICTKGIPTTCASMSLRDFVPPYDATVVERMLQQDAVLIGKTNMDEFAMGSSCENSAFFTTCNPWDTTRVPGGSSGGSAAAVASREACMALGSDTGGSIRQPASLTGIVGFKPTYGMVSRYGLVAFASSLDQIGPMTQTVQDTRLLMQVLVGKDEKDSTSVEASKINFLDPEPLEIKGIRMGIPREYMAEGLDPDVRGVIKGAIDRLGSAGAEIVDISLPLSRYAIATYYIVAPSEASSNLARYDGVHYGYRTSSLTDIYHLYAKSREECIGAEVKRRIMLGTYALSSGYYEAYYLRALKVRRLIKEDFDRAFEGVDAILGPTSPVPAFKLGERVFDPLQMYLCDIFTVSTNLAGLPAICIPCGFTPNMLPVGLQIHAKAFDDVKLLKIAQVCEQILGISRYPIPMS
jgi:aspartyl-tRNA(Asn)/glutamyl-tRNA(Gln) amidotransferase subunit A